MRRLLEGSQKMDKGDLSMTSVAVTVPELCTYLYTYYDIDIIPCTWKTCTGQVRRGQELEYLPLPVLICTYLRTQTYLCVCLFAFYGMLCHSH